MYCLFHKNVSVTYVYKQLPHVYRVDIFIFNIKIMTCLDNKSMFIDHVRSRRVNLYRYLKFIYELLNIKNYTLLKHCQKHCHLELLQMIHVNNLIDIWQIYWDWKLQNPWTNTSFFQWLNSRPKSFLEEIFNSCLYFSIWSLEWLTGPKNPLLYNIFLRAYKIDWWIFIFVFWNSQ